MTEVRFCSLCDESVPESKVQDGRVLVLEKRSLCEDCKRLVAKVGGSSRGPGMGVIGVGLALVAGATSIWGWQNSTCRGPPTPLRITPAIRRSGSNC